MRRYMALCLIMLISYSIYIFKQNSAVACGGGGGCSKPSASFTMEPPAGPYGYMEAGTEIVFDASASSDGQSSITCTWDFGDGTASGEVVTHTFEAAGVYDVVLTVTDSDCSVGCCPDKQDTETRTMRASSSSGACGWTTPCQCCELGFY